jgi:hypothetical protein
MKKLTLDNITMQDLSERIDDLRDVLNEICCTDPSVDVQEERLIISRNLDELIVKYMKELSASQVASDKLE